MNGESVFTGVLFGTAVGDALGLPAEGLSPRKSQAAMARRLKAETHLRWWHLERRHRTHDHRRPSLARLAAGSRSIPTRTCSAPEVVVCATAGWSGTGDCPSLPETVVGGLAGLAMHKNVSASPRRGLGRLRSIRKAGCAARMFRTRQFRPEHLLSRGDSLAWIFPACLMTEGHG